MTILTFANWIAEAPGWILSLPQGLQRLIFQFYQVFIFENRWKFFTDGLVTTFVVTIGALMLGIIIGMIVALIRSSQFLTHLLISHVVGYSPFSSRRGVVVGFRANPRLPAIEAWF